jgi:hypothetical protein
VKERFNCEYKFYYDSLPKDKEEDGLVSIPEFQLNFSYSTTIQQDGKENTYSECAHCRRIETCAKEKSEDSIETW